MKFKKATYFSLFFLLSFIASVSASTISAYQSKAAAHLFSSKSSNSIHQGDFDSNSQPDVLLEENENETENEFELHEFTLPFHFSYYIYDVTITSVVSVKPLTQKRANPIYLSVCNFRI
jgi:hypothetical protein